MYPTLQYENKLWKKGIKFVAGIDEVGRGALAGPLVVSAVIFPITIEKVASTILANVRDSKLLTPNNRKLLFPLIRKHSIYHSFGQSTVMEINRFGIVKATHIAMRRALNKLQKTQFVLIDALNIPHLKNLPQTKQLAITKGDKHCFTIAAASILAKVHRDHLLVKLGKLYPHYKLEKHKGYGTLAHRQAIQKHGPQPFHRQLFIRKLI